MLSYKTDSLFVSSKYLVKALHRHSCCFSSIKVSCKKFFYYLSKELINYWSFSYCFLYLLYFSMITSYITLLPIDHPHAVPLDIGIAIKPNSVRDSVIDLDVVAIIKIVSIDLIFVVIVLYLFLSRLVFSYLRSK